MITEIHVENFKSLADFTLTGMGNFVCLIGLNGAGKTTLLQALDFIGQLANGVPEFRGWDKSEIPTIGQSLRTCTFSLSFKRSESNETLQWKGRYNIQTGRFTEEVVSMDGIVVFQLKEGRLTLSGPSDDGIPSSSSALNYQGSVLNVLNTKNPDVDYVRDQMRQLKSIDLLSPDSLRKSSQGDTELGNGGIGLPGFLNSLSEENARALLQELKGFYPNLAEYVIGRRRFGWKRLLIRETVFGKSQLPAHQENDGLLRVLAILSQRYAHRGFLLFDEVENGINQELLGLLVKKLLSFGDKQVFVTTHSALLVNYLPDDRAKESLYLLYRDANGYAGAIRFFNISGMVNRLDVLGPGEVMGAVNLVDVSRSVAEAAAMRKRTEV